VVVVGCHSLFVIFCMIRRIGYVFFYFFVFFPKLFCFVVFDFFNFIFLLLKMGIVYIPVLVLM